MPDAVAPVIALEHVWFSYGGTPVVEDASLEVERRDFLCLIGPNGGGKTTLLKLMLGLLAPDRGAVRVFGEAPARGRMRLGYVAQSFLYDPQFPMRVYDVVLMGRLDRRRWWGGPGGADRDAARAALAQVGLDGLRHRPFADLSGGERQRVLIARALAAEPEALLLDEPTANVDPGAEGGLYELLRELNARLALVLVSHDLGFVTQLVKRVACVNRRVVVHPTSAVSGEMILETYGRDVRLVRHDHQCAEGREERGA